MKPCFEFRNMTRADLSSVCDIELSAFEFPWNKNIFNSCLGDGYYAAVMFDKKKIIAYGVISYAAGEAHLLNICVRPEMQRKGFGRFMLEHLLVYAQHVRVETVFLEVRCSNSKALEFYDAAGFSEIGLRKGYYPAHQGREGAVVMAFDLLKGLSIHMG